MTGYQLPSTEVAPFPAIPFCMIDHLRECEQGCDGVVVVVEGARLMTSCSSCSRVMMGTAA